LKDKLVVLLVSPNEIDLEKLKLNYPSWIQNEFEIFHLKDESKIFKALADYEPDVIITRQADKISHYPNMVNMRFEERKKWIHLNEFDNGEAVMNCFINSLNDNRQKLFSVITPTYNTEIYQIERAYNSLINQTYTNWEWVILNVGDNEETFKKLKEISSNDIRVRLFSGHSKQYSIGHNKKMLGGLAIGEYIVEMDHDDELTNDALQLINEAFENFKNVGFVYSDCSEVFDDGTFVEYPEGWGFGYGSKYWQEYNGKNWLVMSTPEINPQTIRHITSAPNHVRAWRKEIYDKIHGHNEKMFVADDYEIIVKTFLNTIMLKIPKLLYIQHYKDGNTAQRERNKEIQRLVQYVSNFYNEDIKNRFEELMVRDYVFYNEPVPEIQQNVNISLKN